MRIQKTHAAAALALAGALASTAVTPSFADSRWGYAAGGFAVGALVGAAAVNSSYYYGPGYAYGYYPNAYEGYAYVPAPAPVYSYRPAYYSYGYVPAPVYSYGPAYYSYGYVPAPTYYRNGYRSNYDPDGRIGGSFKMNSSGKEDD